MVLRKLQGRQNAFTVQEKSVCKWIRTADTHAVQGSEVALQTLWCNLLKTEQGAVCSLEVHLIVELAPSGILVTVNLLHSSSVCHPLSSQSAANLMTPNYCRTLKMAT